MIELVVGSRSFPSLVIAVVAHVLLAQAATLAAQTFDAPKGEAQNVRFEQRNSGVVEIYYDLISSEPGAVFTVAVEGSQDNGASWGMRPKTMTGDVGAGVRPGTGKKIVWDSGKDVERIEFNSLRFRMQATGGPLSANTAKPTAADPVVGPAKVVADQRQSSLRIVVLVGEDAVNIVQQKTAVAPIIEVRDRNNLPVAGATVTFAVGQGATLGGASTLTVVTNAAGQAVATGFTPTAAGAIQVQATAFFQGQTAIATITQTNVLTAAQAAGLATSSAGGAGAGPGGTTAAGGGGISGLTLGLVAGGLGAGTLVATQLGGDKPEPVTPAASCSYSLSPSTQSVGEAGGGFTTNLTTTCAWSAASDTTWLSLSNSSGSGSSTISYSALPNTGASRAGQISITGAGGRAVLSVSQDAGTVAGNWSGTTASSPTVRFGGLPYCDYDITLTNIRAALTVTASGAVTGGQVSALATERAFSCSFPPLPPSTFMWTVETGSIIGSAVSVTFRPVNLGVNLAFSGQLSGLSTINGTLTFRRFDTGTPLLDWVVTAPMTITRDR